MGIAALVILICHSNAYITFPSFFPSQTTRILGTCAQYGVKIFFFLSAIRLFFSMKKNDNVRDFYKKRLVRILIPYIMISLVCLPIKYFVITNTPWAFISDFFLFGYYVNGKSTWFIAAILPMYFIYPFLYRARIKFKWFSPISAIIYFALALVLKGAFPDYYNILTNMISGGFAFLMGIIIAPYVYEKKKFNTLTLLTMLAAYLLLFVVFKVGKTYIGGVTIELLSSSLPIICCYVCAFILDKLPKIFNKIFEFCGKMSLELYLLGTVIYIMAAFGLDSLVSEIEPRGFLFYFIAMIITFILAIGFFNLNKHITSLLYKNKKSS